MVGNVEVVLFPADMDVRRIIFVRSHVYFCNFFKSAMFPLLASIISGTSVIRLAELTGL